MKIKHTSLLLINSCVVILIWLLLLYFFPRQEKYQVLIIEESSKRSNDIIIYKDLYNDNNSEEILFVKDYLGYASIYIKDNEKVPWQWNLNGEFCPGKFYLFEDINADGIKDVFVFTHRNDSIFLNLYNTGLEKEVFEDLFITNFDRINNRIDFSVYHSQIVDLKNNGKLELLSNFNCAFSHTTRKLCLIDLQDRTVKLSPKAGTSLVSKPIIRDIDNDGQKEIMGELFCPGNTQLAYSFSDQYAWLQVYDANLQFKFPPKKIGLYPARLTIQPIQRNNDILLLGLYNHSGNKDSSFIALYTNTGNLISKKIINAGDDYCFCTLSPNNGVSGRSELIYSDGRIYAVDDYLNLHQKEKCIPFYINSGWAFDIDDDDEPERILRTKDATRILIARNDYSHSALLEIQTSLKPYYLSLQRNGGKSYLAASTHAILYRIVYEKNWLHVYYWPIAVGVLILISALIWLLTWMQKKLLLKRIESEKRIAALQVKAIKNQMTPHFTLNILNSIGSLYASDNREKADMALGKFAKLLRTALITSDSITVELYEELSFVKDYLDLEKIRLNGQLNYRFHISESVQQKSKIPKMLLHTFIENSIKHGIRHLPFETQGELILSVEQEGDMLHVSIEDNGIGRDAALAYNEYSTKQGLQILNEIISIYKQAERKSIEYAINDSTSFDSGTCVTINLSLN